jgi:hypothetical protein
VAQDYKFEEISVNSSILPIWAIRDFDVPIEAFEHIPNLVALGADDGRLICERDTEWHHASGRMRRSLFGIRNLACDNIQIALLFEWAYRVGVSSVLNPRAGVRALHASNMFYVNGTWIQRVVIHFMLMANERSRELAYRLGLAQHPAGFTLDHRNEWLSGWVGALGVTRLAIELLRSGLSVALPRIDDDFKNAVDLLAEGDDLRICCQVKSQARKTRTTSRVISTRPNGDSSKDVKAFWAGAQVIGNRHGGDWCNLYVIVGLKPDSDNRPPRMWDREDPRIVKHMRRDLKSNRTH